MSANERLYEIIEEAARTKNPIQLKPEEGEMLRLSMFTNTKALVEDLYWQDERKHIYQAVVEAGFERNGDFFTAGFYVCGNQCLEGFGSGRTTIFRVNNRYSKEDEHIRQIGKDLIEKHLIEKHKGALKELAKGEKTND